MLKEQVKDFSKVEQYAREWDITIEEIEQYAMHYEYHMKNKVNDDSLGNFLFFFECTNTIKANDVAGFVEEFYKEDLDKLQIFKYTNTKDILNIVDTNRLFEDLYEDYYISFFMLENKENEFLFTKKDSVEEYDKIIYLDKCNEIAYLHECEIEHMNQQAISNNYEDDDHMPF